MPKKKKKKKNKEKYDRSLTAAELEDIKANVSEDEFIGLGESEPGEFIQEVHRGVPCTCGSIRTVILWCGDGCTGWFTGHCFECHRHEEEMSTWGDKHAAACWTYPEAVTYVAIQSGVRHMKKDLETKMNNLLTLLDSLEKPKGIKEAEDSLR